MPGCVPLLDRCERFCRRGCTGRASPFVNCLGGSVTVHERHHITRTCLPIGRHSSDCVIEARVCTQVSLWIFVPRDADFFPKMETDSLTLKPYSASDWLGLLAFICWSEPVTGRAGAGLRRIFRHHPRKLELSCGMVRGVPSGDVMFSRGLPRSCSPPCSSLPGQPRQRERVKQSLVPVRHYPQL